MVKFIKNICNQYPVSVYVSIMLLFATAGIIINRDFLEKQALADIVKITQEQFGSLPLAPEQERFIRDIAAEIGLEKKLVIRKMNPRALASFGYHNAFAYNPQTPYFLPIESTSFLFVSEGFFEDLSPEEQRFLIGHELIHIKHGHLHYFHLGLILFFALFLIFLWQPAKYIMVIMRKRFPLFYSKYIPWVTTALLVGICVASTSLVALAYRRYIEREADCVSMQLLNSHAGCLLLTERWHKECKIALHNPYFGITADHPSCAERQTYCLALQHQSIQKDLT